MQLIRFSSSFVIFCFALLSLSFPCRAELSAHDSRELKSLTQACIAHQRQIEAMTTKLPASPQASLLKLLESPIRLSPLYWTIRDRSLKHSIRDVASARDYSAIDGRLGHVELTCSGHVEMQAWKALAKRDARAQVVSSWKNSVRKRLEAPISYSEYLKIMETAAYFAQRKLITLSPAVISLKKAVENQLHEPATKSGLAPSISNATDPKWTEWSRKNQARELKTRELMTSARQTLAKAITAPGNIL